MRLSTRVRSLRIIFGHRVPSLPQCHGLRDRRNSCPLPTLVLFLGPPEKPPPCELQAPAPQTAPPFPRTRPSFSVVQGTWITGRSDPLYHRNQSRIVKNRVTLRAAYRLRPFLFSCFFPRLRTEPGPRSALIVPRPPPLHDRDSSTVASSRISSHGKA